MNYFLKGKLSPVICAFFIFSTSANAIDDQSASINALSPDYNHQARFEFSENDVISFVYQWFAAFDHQREAGYFLNRISNTPEMDYPDFKIRSQGDFLRWYQGVEENIAWNSHKLSGIKVSGDQENGWQVSYKVNWRAKTYSGQAYDLLVDQQVRLIRVGDSFKLTSLKATLDEK